MCFNVLNLTLLLGVGYNMAVKELGFAHVSTKTWA